jgi:ubiquinone/menaquinone biosynthesis C-methylase UbiE
LPYADNSFDHVVSTLVFCSVQDQHQALQELRRVLKPDGTLHMVEHVRPRTPLLAELFRLLTPWWRRVADNCHLDRPTLAVLTESGWDVQVKRRLFMVVNVKAKPAPAPRFSAIRTDGNVAFYQ